MLIQLPVLRPCLRRCGLCGCRDTRCGRLSKGIVSAPRAAQHLPPADGDGSSASGCLSGAAVALTAAANVAGGYASVSNMLLSTLHSVLMYMSAPAHAASGSTQGRTRRLQRERQLLHLLQHLCPPVCGGRRGLERLEQQAFQRLCCLLLGLRAGEERQGWALDLRHPVWCDGTSGSPRMHSEPSSFGGMCHTDSHVSSMPAASPPCCARLSPSVACGLSRSAQTGSSPAAPQSACTRPAGGPAPAAPPSGPVRSRREEKMRAVRCS